MRAVKDGHAADVAAVRDTAFCCGCGVCEMYACPQGLNPRSLIAACKDELRKNGVHPPQVEGTGVLEMRDYARLPMSRLLARLDLVRYNVPAPLDEREIVPKRVKLPLSQHIGAPARAVVSEGERVARGQCVAAVEDDQLGADIHTPICGMVVQATDTYIMIEAKQEGGADANA